MKTNSLHKIRKEMAFKYWCLTIKFKIYILKYKHALEIPYR
ncbi:hypothetical protein [Neotamlana nanhaiensis]|nr:hypothetical protein [Tamlana nanhaiensis]